MKSLGPIGISALLSLALLGLAGLAFAITSSGGGGVPTTAGRPTQPGITTSGDAMDCPGGGQVQSYYNLVGDQFRLVGSLASSIDGKSLLVKGPAQYIRMGLTDNAQVDGTLTFGVLVKVSGTFDSQGNIEATTVELACGAAAVAAVTPAPTAFPQPSPSPQPPRPAPTARANVVVAAVTPAPTAFPQPSPSPQPPRPAPTARANVAVAKPAHAIQPTRPPSHSQDKPVKHHD
jgi:hypothetical protein